METSEAWRAPAAPLSDEEVAAVGERLRLLRRRRDSGELSTDEYAEQVRTVLERRRRVGPGHEPERRHGDSVATAG